MSEYKKYPRTPHLPFSPGASRDDLKLKNLNHFIGKEVVVTVKLDGECTSMYNDHIHARSTDSMDHASRHFVKGLHGAIKHNIYRNIRICGENMYAKHSIHYRHLDSFFYVFSTWDKFEGCCLPWKHTIATVKSLLLKHVPVLYEGVFDEELIHGLALNRTFNDDDCEGLVVRLASGFSYRDFDKSVAKYVRAGHVNTESHWMHGELIKNLLRNKV